MLEYQNCGRVGRVLQPWQRSSCYSSLISFQTTLVASVADNWRGVGMAAWLWAVLAIVPLTVGMVVECLLEVTRNEGDGRRDDVPFFVDFRGLL